MKFKSRRKRPRKTLKKRLIRLALILVAFIAVVIIFISPITKYMIEKHDVKFLGREITMDWAYVNPFTGYIHFDNLKIYEEKSDSIFFKSSGISVNFAMMKLLTKTYEISSITIDEAKASLISTENVFNFNDLILRFAAKDTLEKNKEPLHFNILDIELNDSEVTFKQTNSPINFSFLKINFNSDGKYWDNDVVRGKLSLISGVGTGFVDAKFFVNTNSLDYNVDAMVKNFNLNITKQYLIALADYGNISGKANIDIQAKGNLNNKQDVDAKGKVIINKFHFGKDSLNDFVSFNKLTVDFKKIAPAQKIFKIDSIILDKPIFKYEKYDHLDNIQKMFGEKGSKIESAKANPKEFNLLIEAQEYIQVLFKDFFKSDYKINSLAVVDADIKFNDYSPNEKFAIALSPLNIRADSLDNQNRLLKVDLKSGVQPYGSISASFSMDPRTNDDFNLKYDVRKIPVPLFNPYLITYTSFPLNRGKIELHGNWKIRKNTIQSNNHLIVIDPRIFNKIKKNDTRWIPLRFVMFFVRERGNVIDYEVPVTGNLNDPDFHFRDVIIDVLTNIFVKPATTAYRYEVRNVEVEVEKSITVGWNMRQKELNKDQTKFLSKISDFLAETPDAKIVVSPMTYAEKEKEYILFYLAKKKYYLSLKKEDQNVMTQKDSLAIEKMSSKDSLFIKYLDKNAKGHLLYTVQEKCYRLVSVNAVNREYERLIAVRNKALIDYFKEENTSKQVKIASNNNKIPFKGFSYFEITYKGDFPDYLIDANQELNEFNDRSPRAKYKKFRRNKF